MKILQGCLYKSQLFDEIPSSRSQEKLWGEFQLTRLSRPLLEQFYKLTASISSQKVDVDVAFQLIIGRCMKLIVEKATRSLKLKNAVAPIATPVETISLREKNAIRYMAGYVMMKLRKKFGRKISDASVIYKKYKWFVHVLDSFNVSPTAVDVSTIDRYTPMNGFSKETEVDCVEVIYSIYVLYIDNFCVYFFAGAKCYGSDRDSCPKSLDY